MESDSDSTWNLITDRKRKLVGINIAIVLNQRAQSQRTIEGGGTIIERGESEKGAEETGERTTGKRKTESKGKREWLCSE